MAQKRFINIQFPFSDDPEGKFLEMNTEPKRAIKADLVHLLLTNKGERLYMPDFGANLRQYIFEPNDEPSYSAIKNEINTAISKFIPNLNVTELTVTPSENNIHAVIVRLDYVVTTGAFESNDFVILEI
ncbi:MAG: GPW/gp25 family protein [bacterium]|jgi:phage baseplate assembly protein W